MGFDEIVSLVVNNATSLVVLAYFLFRDYKYIDKLTVTLTQLVTVVTDIRSTMNERDEE